VAAASAAEQSIFERLIADEQRDAYQEVNNFLTLTPEVDERELVDHRDDSIRLLTMLLKDRGGAFRPHIAPSSAVTQIKLQEEYGAVTSDSEVQFYSKAHEHAARRWFESQVEAQS